jgi:hypothetical protein
MRNTHLELRASFTLLDSTVNSNCLILITQIHIRTHSSPMPDTPVAEIEAVPVQAQIVSGDERTSSWYYRQADGIVPDCREAREQQHTLRMMGSLKMYQQHL